MPQKVFADLTNGHTIKFFEINVNIIGACIDRISYLYRSSGESILIHFPFHSFGCDSSVSADVFIKIEPFFV